MVNKSFEVSGAPHSSVCESNSEVMGDVIIALIPAGIAGVMVFRLNALIVILYSIIFCVAVEYIFSKIILKKNTTGDLSAIVTGLLLAYNLPASAPWWLILAGAFFSIVIGKLVFGGLGQNPFNPALVGRVALLVSWPSLMTTWPKAQPVQSLKQIFQSIDGTTAATPLGILKEKGISFLEGSTQFSILPDLFFGNCGGSLGEISAFAIILGAIYLYIRGQITLHIPLAFIATVFIVSYIFNLMDPSRYADPFFHILSGGVMLGAVFMATDMVNSPMTNKAMIIFGIGCGALTMTIRMLGAYPEGVSFSILLMNSLMPLLDKFFPLKRYGKF